MPSIQISFSGRPEHLSERKDNLPPAAIHFWHITETEQELSVRLAHDPDSISEASRRFRSAARRREWMAVRVLLAAVAGPSVRLEYTPAGCPFLSGRSAHVSIAHTGNYVVLALSPGGRIGIDIERRTPRALRLRKKFLTPDEETLLWKGTDALPAYAALSEEDRAVLLWSAKEAAYKYFAPAGGAALLQDIHLYLDSDSRLMASGRGGEQVVEVRFSVSETLILTVCQ